MLGAGVMLGGGRGDVRGRAEVGEAGVAGIMSKDTSACSTAPDPIGRFLIWDGSESIRFILHILVANFEDTLYLLHIRKYQQ